MAKKRVHGGKAPRPRNLAGVRPNKRLGQNFLIDEEVISTIIEASGVTKDTLVLEIGPGTGALTLPLAESAGHVIAVDLDPDMIDGLRIKTFGMDNVELIQGDILETDIKRISEESMKEHGLSELRIIGNLPYYITTPIIMKLLDSDTGAKSITVMMQKEVADRISSAPGSRIYGAISVAVQYYCSVTKITDVPKEAFVPRPKVASTVLRLQPLGEKQVLVKDEKMLLRCVKAGFAQRRKTLLNSLSSAGGTDKDTVRRILEAADIDPGRRAETLTVEEFGRIADKFSDEHNQRNS